LARWWSWSTRAAGRDLPDRDARLVPLSELWPPVFVSAALVVSASYVLHRVLNYHLRDYDRLANEADVIEALERLGVPPGNYPMPLPTTSREMMGPAFMVRRARGPIWLNVMRPFSMRMVLLEWFAYALVVGVFTAHVTGQALGPRAAPREVARFAGTIAFGGHSLALWQRSIWYQTKWSRTLRSTFDGLVYGILTGLAFAALWPET
jgi:hypothetical protein